MENKKAEAEAAKKLKAAEQMGRQIIEEARKTANNEAIKTLKELEQKGRQIINEAVKIAEEDANRIVAQAEEKARQIIEEARGRTQAEAKPGRPASEAEQEGLRIIEDARTKAEAAARKILAEAENRARQMPQEAKKTQAEAKAGRPASEAEQEGLRIIEDARKKAETDASKIVAQAEEKARQITEEAKSRVGSEVKADRIIAEAELKARQIIEEAQRIAAAPVAERPQNIVKAAKDKAARGTKAKQEKRVAAYNRAELVIVPPIDFAQLEKLRISLQQLTNLRILATEGSSEGGTSISIIMKKPEPLIPELKKIDAVEEAIEEELLDSHPLGNIVKQELPTRPPKRDDEQRILVVLKRTR